MNAAYRELYLAKGRILLQGPRTSLTQWHLESLDKAMDHHLQGTSPDLSRPDYWAQVRSVLKRKARRAGPGEAQDEILEALQHFTP